jgi:hypothetical protein
MKISKYISVLAVAILALAMTSCSSYLDKDPENSVPEKGVDFTDIANMYQPVSGVYAKLRTSGAHWVIWPLSIIRDDDVWSGRVDDQAILNQFGGKTNDPTGYNYDDSFWGLNEMWNQYYGLIKVANAALVSLDSYAANITSSSDLATNHAYQGEVRILRAYAYWRLSQEFGPVTLLKSNSQTDLTRSSVKAFISTFLTTFSMLSKTALRFVLRVAHVGAATAYTAEALAAKVCLTDGDYSKVESFTDDIINSGKFSLYPDYYELFKIPANFVTRVCWKFSVPTLALVLAMPLLPTAGSFSRVLPTTATSLVGDSLDYTRHSATGLRQEARLSVTLLLSWRLVLQRQVAMLSVRSRILLRPIAGTARLTLQQRVDCWTYRLWYEQQCPPSPLRRCPSHERRG